MKKILPLSCLCVLSAAAASAQPEGVKRIAVFGTAHRTGVENALKATAGLIAKDNPAGIPTLPLRHRDLTVASLAEKIGRYYREVTSDSSAVR